MSVAKRAPNVHISQSLTSDPMATEQERFWAKVDKSGDCWLWTAARLRFGHGVFKRHVAGVWKQQKAHRVAYEYMVGPIPDGLFVCHHCDTPPCCNPAHLFVGTAADNMRDMSEKGRASRWRALPPGEAKRRRQEQNARWCARNPERVREYGRAYKTRNPEKYAAMIERRRLRKIEQRREKGVRPAGEYATHCIRGHVRDGANLRTTNSGARHCRECDRIPERNRKARRAAA